MQFDPASEKKFFKLIAVLIKGHDNNLKLLTKARISLQEYYQIYTTQCEMIKNNDKDEHAGDQLENMNKTKEQIKQLLKIVTD